MLFREREGGMRLGRVGWGDYFFVYQTGLRQRVQKMRKFRLVKHSFGYLGHSSKPSYYMRIYNSNVDYRTGVKVIKSLWSM